MYTKRILTVLATGALSLGLVAGASASGAVPGDVTPDAAFGPAQHDGGHDNGGQPDNPGQPSDPGQPDDTGRPDEGPSQANTAGAENSRAPLTPGAPDDAGRPDDAGPGLRSMLELPSNVSLRAAAAVGAAFELQDMIAERIAVIRGLLSEELSDGAVSDVVREFGDMFRYVSDAIAEVETPGGGESAGIDADGEGDEGGQDEGDEDDE